jgi:uncharacterized membrane protein YedE/YeeE
MQKAYINPYLAGVLLGLVLLSSFVIAGRGIGASGAASQVIAHSYSALDISNSYLEAQKTDDSLFDSWIIIEVVGILLGAFLSAWQSGRFKVELIKSSNITRNHRLKMALLGGVFMGFAARLARGCTSGQAITGGALLSTGSWLFMIAVFIGAYISIYFIKRNWS